MICIGIVFSLAISDNFNIPPSFVICIWVTLWLILANECPWCITGMPKQAAHLVEIRVSCKQVNIILSVIFKPEYPTKRITDASVVKSCKIFLYFFIHLCSQKNHFANINVLIVYKSFSWLRLIRNTFSGEYWIMKIKEEKNSLDPCTIRI